MAKRKVREPPPPPPVIPWEVWAADPAGIPPAALAAVTARLEREHARLTRLLAALAEPCPEPAAVAQAARCYGDLIDLDWRLADTRLWDERRRVEKEIAHRRKGAEEKAAWWRAAHDYWIKIARELRPRRLSINATATAVIH
jgi:hypothetical protein